MAQVAEARQRLRKIGELVDGQADTGGFERAEGRLAQAQQAVGGGDLVRQRLQAGQPLAGLDEVLLQGAVLLLEQRALGAELVGVGRFEEQMEVGGGEDQHGAHAHQRRRQDEVDDGGRQLQLANAPVRVVGKDYGVEAFLHLSCL